MGFLLITLILSVSFALAEDTEEQKIQKAYEWVFAKVAERGCNALSTEEKVFVLLATGQCEDALKNSAKTVNSQQQCFTPTGTGTSCDLKSTAQAALALENEGIDATKAGNWLISQKKVPGTMKWILQVESNEATACTIKYDSTTISLTIGVDKKIKTLSPGCFSKYQNDYWLLIAPTCREKTFNISCDKSFLTNLIYTEGEQTFFISEKTHAASENEQTQEKVESLCFTQSDNCELDYEGGLWAALALDVMYFDWDAFAPYLMANAEKTVNKKYMPYAFLYQLQGSEYYGSLISSKKTVSAGDYWEYLSDPYFGTAMSAFVLDNSFPTTGKDWLLSTQSADKSWRGDLTNTAFILYSVWPGMYVPPVEPECGNGVVEGDEECDDGNLEDGDGCSEDCEEEVPPEPYCGDSIINGNETCEANNLDGKDCTDFSFDFGNLSCKAPGSVGACTFNTSGCGNEPEIECDPAPCPEGKICYLHVCIDDPDTVVCGNGLIESGESCEGNNWGNITNCSTLGSRFIGGNLSCSDDCVFDTTECVQIPGDECDTDAECVDLYGEGYVCGSDGECKRDDRKDCEFWDYFCRGRSDCQGDGGTILDSEYECNTPDVCCNIGGEKKTCSEMNGEKCTSDQSCTGTEDYNAKDITSGQFCCLRGVCQNPSQLSDCENAGGQCKANCADDESTIYEDCDIYSDFCCISSTGCTTDDDCFTDQTCDDGVCIDKKKTSYWWLWVLLILIVIVVVGILFKDKLRVYYMQIMSKFGGKKPPRRGPPGFPPPSGRMPSRPLMPRRMMPPPRRGPPPRAPPKPAPSKPKGDFEDVLKKLKDMGS